jgi:hypothetical protein
MSIEKPAGDRLDLSTDFIRATLPDLSGTLVRPNYYAKYTWYLTSP